MRGAGLFCCVPVGPRKKKQEQRNERDEKREIRQRQKVYFERKREKNKRERRNPHLVLASCCVRRCWLKNDSQPERKIMFVFNREAVRECVDNWLELSRCCVTTRSEWCDLCHMCVVVKRRLAAACQRARQRRKAERISRRQRPIRPILCVLTHPQRRFFFDYFATK